MEVEIDKPTYDALGSFKTCPECGGRIIETEVHVCPAIQGLQFTQHQIPPNGYYCSCGQWVIYGVPHTCGIYDEMCFTPVLHDIILHEKIDRLLRLAEKANVAKEAEIVERWINEYEEKFGTEQEMNFNIGIAHMRGWVDLRGKGEE